MQRVRQGQFCGIDGGADFILTQQVFALINAYFAHGLPLTVTSVAYRLNGETVLGIVNAPLLRECYIAEKGKGAWRNGERISVSSVAACENALVATGFP